MVMATNTTHAVYTTGGSEHEEDFGAEVIYRPGETILDVIQVGEDTCHPTRGPRFLYHLPHLDNYDIEEIRETLASMDYYPEDDEIREMIRDNSLWRYI